MTTSSTAAGAGTVRVDRVVRRARVATFGYFGLNGFVLGMWVVHIPAVEHHTHISAATLGYLLLVLGAGGFVGMRLTGPLTDRLGPRLVVPTSAVLCSVAVVGPGLVTNAAGLAAALFALGFANGCLDVSMNTHAVQVEARYGRPVMSSFHAVFSVGGFVAALIGAQTLGQHLTPKTTLSVVGVVGVVSALALVPLLLRAAPVSAHGQASGERAGRRRPPSRIWWLAALAFALMLTEGVAYDWSTLSARDGLGASASVAALAYGAFAGAMTVGRFTADRVSAAVGPITVLRGGAATAVVALGIVASSPWIGLTIAAWALLGLGLSGCVPQLFSAAGHVDPTAAGANVSRVAGLGYLGMLAGPAVIGPLTHVFEIQHTFFLPMVLCCAVVLFGRVAKA